MCLVWCLDLQVQGVANPLHLQVKIDTNTFPLQVVVATESQEARVSVPPPPASGTDFSLVTKECVCTVCSHDTVETSQTLEYR